MASIAEAGQAFWSFFSSDNSRWKSDAASNPLYTLAKRR
jgi:hypothetical protein